MCFYYKCPYSNKRPHSNKRPCSNIIILQRHQSTYQQQFIFLNYVLIAHTHYAALHKHWSSSDFLHHYVHVSS